MIAALPTYLGVFKTAPSSIADTEKSTMSESPRVSSKPVARGNGPPLSEAESLMVVRRRRRRMRGLGRYTLKLLKRMHPSYQMSSKSVRVINEVCNDFAEMLMEEVLCLQRCSHRRTVKAVTVERALRLLLGRVPEGMSGENQLVKDMITFSRDRANTFADTVMEEKAKRQSEETGD